jgi:hypothetical protein
MLCFANFPPVAILGLDGTIQIATSRQLKYEMKTIDDENCLMLAFSDEDSRDAAEKAFLARHAQLKEATQRSLMALQTLEEDEDASVADIGMLYLEQSKLRKELNAMETMSEVHTVYHWSKILLKPAEWHAVSKLGFVSWIPNEHKLKHQVEQEKIPAVLRVAFDKKTKTFSFSA